MSEESRNMREMSRVQWTTKGPDSNENINCGSLLRIADAVETMARDRVQLERDLAWYKDHHTRDQEYIGFLERSRASLRGVATRMKRERDG